MTQVATAGGAPPIVIIGGKGGVGKTTVAAATALALADAGRRTLVLSTDPAHSLGDALASRLADRPRRVAPQLWAAEPDADAAVRARVDQVTDDAYAALPRKIMPAVQRHLETASNAPGMTESALNDLFIEYLGRVPRDWDHLVVDSAPTGHLLRMLELPSLLAPWVRGLARQRERAVDADRFATGVLGTADEADDPLLARLHARRRRLEGAADRLRTEATVHLVVLARRMVLAESARSATSLTSAGFVLGDAVLNHVPSESDSTWSQLVREQLGVPGVVELAAADAEPIGPERLRALGVALTEGGFPCGDHRTSTTNR
ncbi:ArsA family ATPase [Haloechinothrix sp. YIM 98757]|uniref:ArsA family ATPase n=1 Tax=Haloechinothrix aidingensis TaxID=2752311 RepID=A0A837ZZS6_9PSEU|nr:TRC40/GET3/ArsA family transport-energizing ATPase [Haloechinothrix aidingensis]MBA0126106.1 ArsA family ATPase [Haloechinothrix aidingensis]